MSFDTDLFSGFEPNTPDLYPNQNYTQGERFVYPYTYHDTTITSTFTLCPFREMPGTFGNISECQTTGSVKNVGGNYTSVKRGIMLVDRSPDFVSRGKLRRLDSPPLLSELFHPDRTEPVPNVPRSKQPYINPDFQPILDQLPKRLQHLIETNGAKNPVFTLRDLEIVAKKATEIADSTLGKKYEDMYVQKVQSYHELKQSEQPTQSRPRNADFSYIS
ncbi:hypothetical protein BLNAU_8826 [Blattamonas nauphoetae]|uniref:Uncharacterized protein n=1 Tax=Blattamonas nauphoetae TaxID=2049346 RepID=A0ABQ9XXN1_9EUKA|nr:hypothetical protein BLNAU_8826 [Blattamonas nauphoetae]